MNPTGFRLFLAAPPGMYSAAAASGHPVACLSYRIGSGGQLLRAGDPVSHPGWLMVISADHWDGAGNPGRLSGTIVRECAARGFSGILLDSDDPLSPALGAVIGQLEQAAGRNRWDLFVPEHCAAAARYAKLLLSSALSGGSLAVRLKRAAEQYGARRLALCAERSAQDFPLPAPGGTGRALTQAQLRQLRAGLSPAVFFSDSLCAQYFTYAGQDGRPRFVLFDNADSLRKKLMLARSLGIPNAFLTYPEVEEILPGILTNL